MSAQSFAIKPKRTSEPARRAPGLSSAQKHLAQPVMKPTRNLPIQAKLTIGQPNDKYEQEADRVADQVMRMSDADVAQRVQTGTVQPMSIQRLASGEEEQEQLQAKETPGQTPQVSSSVESRINSMKGGGQPLDLSTRSYFEPRFGHDFSHVRVHADSSAADTAKSINARAFTLGNDVVMGGGEYQPSTESGQKLLGHELAHVIQQTGEINRVKIDVVNDQNTEKKKVIKAAAAAEALVNSAQKYMGGSKRDKYKTWFDFTYNPGNNTSQKRFNDVKKDWVKMHSVFKSKTINFDCSARNSAWFAEVDTIDGKYSMKLGKDFWAANLYGRDSQAGTIVHEISHEELDTDDHRYGEQDAKNMALGDPAKAVTNADNWEYFAEG